jgi:hypothetical protein
MNKMNIIVACEESQAITKELRKLGHNAYSCDLLSTSGGHKEWHYKGDIFDIINKKKVTFITEDNTKVKIQKWDMMIAHPPCTFLAVSGARWFYHPDDSHLPTGERRPHPKFPNRRKDQKDAIDFVIKLWSAKIDKIAIENPIGVLSSSSLGKPTQIIQPWWFGDNATKTTCYWTKGLPNLKKNNQVEKKELLGEKIEKGEVITLSSGKKMQKWYAEALAKSKTADERRTLRSKTFPNMAKAIAKQWTK